MTMRWFAFFIFVATWHRTDETYRGGDLPAVVVSSTYPDAELLARLLQAEAQHDPLDKLYILQVVLNRMETSGKTVLEVISQKHQFSGYNNDRFHSPYDAADYQLAKQVLADNPKVHGYRHFLNPSIATDEKFKAIAEKNQGKWIGSHFYF